MEILRLEESIMYKNIYKDSRNGIMFQDYVELENGVRGKLIILENRILHYIITESAEVYNTVTMKKLKIRVPKITDKCPYCTVNLQLEDGKRYKTCLIHRLLGFAYIPNPDNYPVINHKDGNKLNLELSNLEWTTFSENTKHAITTGLIPRNKGTEGDSCILSEYSAEQAKKVCELLQEGISPRLIAKQLSVGYDFVIKIRRGETWTYISKDHIFPIMKESSNKYDIKTIMKLEKILREHKGDHTYKEILEMIDIDYNESSRKLVSRINKKISNGESVVQMKDMSKNKIYLNRLHATIS